MYGVYVDVTTRNDFRRLRDEKLELLAERVREKADLFSSVANALDADGNRNGASLYRAHAARSAAAAYRMQFELERREERGRAISYCPRCGGEDCMCYESDYANKHEAQQDQLNYRQAPRIHVSTPSLADDRQLEIFNRVGGLKTNAEAMRLVAAFRKEGWPTTLTRYELDRGVESVISRTTFSA